MGKQLRSRQKRRRRQRYKKRKKEELRDKLANVKDRK